MSSGSREWRSWSLKRFVSIQLSVSSPLQYAEAARNCHQVWLPPCPQSDSLSLNVLDAHNVCNALSPLQTEAGTLGVIVSGDEFWILFSQCFGLVWTSTYFRMIDRADVRD